MSYRAQPHHVVLCFRQSCRIYVKTLLFLVKATQVSIKRLDYDTLLGGANNVIVCVTWLFSFLCIHSRVILIYNIYDGDMIDSHDPLNEIRIILIPQPKGNMQNAKCCVYVIIPVKCSIRYPISTSPYGARSYIIKGTENTGLTAANMFWRCQRFRMMTLCGYNGVMNTFRL